MNKNNNENLSSLINTNFTPHLFDSEKKKSLEPIPLAELEILIERLQASPLSEDEIQKEQLKEVKRICKSLASSLAPAEKDQLNLTLCVLGLCHSQGVETYPSLAQAAIHFGAAATKGLAIAQIYMGDFYAHGVEGLMSQSITQAIYYYSLAAKQKSPIALYKLGTTPDGYLENGKKFKYLSQAAEESFAPALLELGICYELGKKEVEKDTTQAVYYYQQAAKQKSPSALYKLGKCYARGVGVEKNTKKSLRYYRLAAKRGHTRARLRLGCCFLYGKGVKKDFKKAAHYFNLAATKGLASAQYGLYLCYKRGNGAVGDCNMAMKYLSLAANQLHPGALSELTHRHKGYVQEYDYIFKAEEQGSVRAMCWIGTKNLNAGRIDIGAISYLQAAYAGYKKAWVFFDEKNITPLAKEMQLHADQFLLEWVHIGEFAKMCIEAKKSALTVLGKLSDECRQSFNKTQSFGEAIELFKNKFQIFKPLYSVFMNLKKNESAVEFKIKNPVSVEIVLSFMHTFSRVQSTLDSILPFILLKTISEYFSDDSKEDEQILIYEQNEKLKIARENPGNPLFFVTSAPLTEDAKKILYQNKQCHS